MKSQRPQIFVSHYGEQKETITDLLFPIQYLPFNLYVAIDERKFGKINELIKENLKQSEVMIPYITESSVNNIWVNQEIGYAHADDLFILPIFESSSLLSGFISNTVGVKVYDDEIETMHEVVSYLRNEYEPVSIGQYDWFLEFLCPHCSQENTFPITKTQDELWVDYQEENNITRSCVKCGADHSFNPVSLEYENPDE
ncbi:hypothetical protein [Haloarcula sp. CGMCC 1.2071]|uniref:hypothetical protein n=1 Tax=Haloarcula sp. CGMCC 1.2071 TaxID=3111454 RepID=UPI00300F4BE0